MERSRNQQVHMQEIESAEVSLWMKREDQLHPHISGNKFRKLKYNLEEAVDDETFRGDLYEFVSRDLYKSRHKEEFIDLLRERFGEFYLVPEGGTNALAIKGCEEILKEDDEIFDYICVSVGTGGTMTGLINSAGVDQRVLGFPSLKGDFLREEIAKIAIHRENWSLVSDYHFGGYAKINEKLISFINQFYRSTTIPLDPVYTGKMMYGLVDMIKNKQFEKNSRILAIHTGGLQGIDGMNQKLTKKKLPLICVGDE